MKGRRKSDVQLPGTVDTPISDAEPQELSESLREKYRSLCERYESLVIKYTRTARADFAVVRLGWWALRTSANGLALVRRDRIDLSNPRWQELDGHAAERQALRIVEPIDSGRTFASLRDVALTEARDLLARVAPVSRTTRYARVGTRQVLEIRSERVEGDKDVVAILAHDVTEQLQAEAELRLSRDALHHRDRLQVIGQVASGVAHDLNNALNVMRLRLDLLRRKGGSPAEHDAQVASFTQIVEAAAARVARMHDLSRKQLDGTVEPVDLRAVIEEALALARTQFEQHSVVEGRQFHVSFDVPDLPPVRANLAELEHLFVNLLLNARDAMAKGGIIFITARRDGEYAEVTVTDQGTGIPEENLERIFDSFFTTKGKHGTGLGLSMARGTMARLGGTIRARNVDGGAQFVLRFPLSLDSAAAHPPRVRAVPEEVSFGALRILVVDDDNDCLDVMRAVLEAERLVVHTARTGAEAIALLQEQPYDLLLCDVGMPEMSGWQVAQEGRRLRPEMPIYMVTGWASEFAATDPRRASVTGVLGKPLDVDDLRAVLASIAAPSPRKQTNA